MTAPSQTPEAAGLEDAGHIVWWKAGGVDYYPKGESFTVSESCRVEPLVTAASAQARIDAAEARADRLAKALEALQDLFAREGECSMERFERIAEMFRKDTGYLAPGKDPGMLSQQPEGDELRRIYDDWYAGKIKTARAALQQETQP